MLVPSWQQSLHVEANVLQQLRQLLFVDAADLAGRLGELLNVLPRGLIAVHLLRDVPRAAAANLWDDDLTALRGLPRDPAVADLLAKILD